MSKNYNIKTLCNYEHINKLFFQKKTTLIMILLQFQTVLLPRLQPPHKLVSMTFWAVPLCLFVKTNCNYTFHFPFYQLINKNKYIPKSFSKYLTHCSISLALQVRWKWVNSKRNKDAQDKISQYKFKIFVLHSGVKFFLKSQFWLHFKNSDLTWCYVLLVF